MHPLGPAVKPAPCLPLSTPHCQVCVYRHNVLASFEKAPGWRAVYFRRAGEWT